MPNEPVSPEAGARQIVGILRQKGHVAFFAGGCVRDRLMGTVPSDFDIATDATPDRIQALFPRTLAIGAHFGVICVLHAGRPYQVATFRADGRYLDGRHPTGVTYSSPEEDARRRDFTVNGLFYDPVADEVLDFVGGRKDLEMGILRAIGDPAERFREDHLRMLRAVRFAATLDFTIEPGTWAAVCAQAHDLGGVSAERVREELEKLLVCPRRLKGFDLLDASGLLAVILPEVEALKGCDQPPQFHPEGDVFVHTRQMLGLLPERASLRLVLSVLLHDIGKPPTRTFDPAEGRIRFSGHDRVGAEMAAAVLTRLRFPRATVEAVVNAVAAHMMFKDVQRMRVAKLRRFMSRPGFDDELELHRVDCASSHGALDNHAFLLAKREEFANEPLIPPPLVNGHDLLALGWTPGPALGAALEAVQTLQLEGALATRDAALAWLRDRVPAR